MIINLFNELNICFSDSSFVKGECEGEQVG